MFGFRNIFRSLSLHRLAPSLIRWFLWGYFLFFFAFLYIGTISRTFHGSISSWYPVSIGWSYFHTISLFFIFLNIVTTVLGFVHQFSKIFLCGPFSLRNRPSISNWKQVHPKKKLKSTFFLKNVSSLRSTWVNLRDADGRALFHFPFLIILFFHYTFLFLFFFEWVIFFIEMCVCFRGSVGRRPEPQTTTTTTATCRVATHRPVRPAPLLCARLVFFFSFSIETKKKTRPKLGAENRTQSGSALDT